MKEYDPPLSKLYSSAPVPPLALTVIIASFVLLPAPQDNCITSIGIAANTIGAGSVTVALIVPSQFLESLT
ncbi:hypothetical protein D3C85_452220 [compost metagenome]